MKRAVARLLAVVLTGLLLGSGDSARADQTGSSGKAATAVEANSLLQFLDGSSLHGQLRSIDLNGGIEWVHPGAINPIRFRPDNLAWIRFEKPRAINSLGQPTCRFRFNNGDEVFGSLSSIDSEKVELETWFGGTLQAPREALQSATFLSKGYAILYEGPTSFDGWVQSRSQQVWEYRDGALTASRAGTLGRDVKLSGSASISFELAWNGHFSLILALYTPVLDRFDYSSSCYMFYLSQGYVTLQRVQGGAGVINLGQAQIPEMSKKNKLRIDIRANKEDSTLGLLIDDRLVQRWKDPSGFVGQGSGVVFFAQLEGPSINISNIKVAQWEGELAMDDPARSAGKDDLVYLANRDKVSGQLRSVRDGKLSVVAGQNALEIPLSRVTQIHLANPAANLPPNGPWQLRAYLAGGGAVALDLERWNDEEVLGLSSNFGHVGFHPDTVRQLRFNLQRSKGEAGDDGGTTGFWDFE
jgi:hypothetical protein